MQVYLHFNRLFYYTIVGFEVTDGSVISFSTDAPTHLPDLLYGILTSHLRNIGSPTVSSVLPNDSARFRSEDFTVSHR
jgi:hypothetical protein